MADEGFKKGGRVAPFPLDEATPSAPSCDVKETAHLMTDNDYLECWMCHGNQAPWDMIRPCNCAALVHRSCLDRWRAVSPNLNSFAACDVCKTPYEFEDDPLLPVDRPCCSPQCKFGLGVTRDILLGLGVAVGLVALFGLVIVPAIDPTRQRDHFLPADWSQAAVDVVWGITAFFALVGVIGLIVMMVRCLASVCTCCCQGCYQDSDAAHDRAYAASTYPYYGNDIWFCYVCYPIPTPMPVSGMARQTNCCGAMGCDCCTGCSHNVNAGGGNGDGGVVVLVVVVAVLAVLGVVFACILLAMIGGRYVHRYRKLVQRFDEVRNQRVKDLSARDPKTEYQMSDLN